MTLDNVQHAVKTSADVASVGVAGGALIGYLPPIAAGMSILWIGIQIYDYFEKRRDRKGK